MHCCRHRAVLPRSACRKRRYLLFVTDVTRGDTRTAYHRRMPYLSFRQILVGGTRLCRQGGGFHLQGVLGALGHRSRARQGQNPSRTRLPGMRCVSIGRMITLGSGVLAVLAGLPECCRLYQGFYGRLKQGGPHQKLEGLSRWYPLLLQGRAGLTPGQGEREGKDGSSQRIKPC